MLPTHHQMNGNVFHYSLSNRMATSMYIRYRCYASLIHVHDAKTYWKSEIQTENEWKILIEHLDFKISGAA